MDIPAHLSDTTLAEVIQTIEVSGRSGRLQIMRTDIDERASIYFTKGQVVHASTLRNQGEDAVWDLFTWTKGKLLFSEGVAIPPRSINKSNTEIIIEGLRRASKAQDIIQNLPPFETVVKLNTASLTGENGEKLMLEATEWNFLVLVDGQRTLGQIINESTLDSNAAAELIRRLLDQRVIVPVR